MMLAAAAAVGSLHTMAPDRWMPFAALARARGWSPLRAARTTILCGFGHVTVSAALGVAAVFLGLGAVHMIGGRLASLATPLLMLFGLSYMLWGLRRSFRRDPSASCTPTITITRTAITITTTASPSGRSSSSSPPTRAWP
jgi:nickel/cobalt exporter